MVARVNVKSDRQILDIFRKEILKEMRTLGRGVQRNVKAEAPRGRTGALRRKIKMRTGWDGKGPFVRITTTARRTSDGTTYRYGLAIQQRERYLQKGLQKTPRR